MDTEPANIEEVAYVRALAHPLRLRILAMLDERPSSPARLAAALGARINVVAYHVKRLHALRMVELVDVLRSRGFDRPDSHLSRTPLRLDETGWRALAAAADSWLGTVTAIERGVAERGSGELLDAGLVVLLFEAKPFSAAPARPPRGG